MTIESCPDKWKLLTCPPLCLSPFPAYCSCPLPTDLVVGVGIEPTFRAFQTRANPSQLSDLGLANVHLVLVLVQ